MKFIRHTTAATAAFLAIAAGLADAKTPPDLWATVNICDTLKHPNRMGVRASMPGDAARTMMYTRFSAQYYDRPTQRWVDVPKPGGVSPWISAGSGRFARSQTGYTFGGFESTNGTKFVLRGIVDMEWRKGKRVVRTARVHTQAGHPNTAAADPKSYSARSCEIS